jgi:hypothetical protein
MKWLLRVLSPCAVIPAALVCALVILAEPPAARAVTFESPEVQELIKKGLGFLANQTHNQVGGKCLIALAFKKNEHDNNHPKIKEALEACKQASLSWSAGTDNYNLALMIIFLCELEDDSHQELIKRMLAELLSRQKPNGAWGYEGNQNGDTSQTQYAVLAVWMAQRHGYNIPLPVIENVMNWLIRTQDPSGAWGYQGDDPGTNAAQRRSQQPLTVSLTAAALGSLYILTDLVNLPGGPIVPEDKQNSKLPPALQAVEDQKAAANEQRRRNTTKAMQDGKAWLQQHFTATPKHEESEWKFYAFYAYERFQSFREELERDRNEEAKWYNDVYQEMKRTIGADGSWTAGGDTPATNTSFGVLFLCRSTKRAIKHVETLGEGILLGGMGLPPKVEDLRERNGRIVQNAVTGSVDDLLSLLEDENNAELRELADNKQVLKLDTDASRRAGQIAKLRASVTTGSPDARLVAVRSLASVRDFDNVPVLLYALKDKDLRVVIAADKGLRFISRKFEGVISTDALNQESLAELQTRWREWYLSLKPDAELLD